MRDYYLRIEEYPEKIFLVNEFKNSKTWEKLLKEKANKDISVIDYHLQPGLDAEYKNLFKMASDNARSTLKERCLSEYIRNRKIGLRQIQRMLRLNNIPESIECYDISNLHGKNAVGAGVFLKNGIPHKAGYRKYKIKLHNEPNDPAMIFEVLNRRFARISNRELEPPDLILVDGGITQLNAALKAKNDHNLKINIASLAKKKRRNIPPKWKNT